MGETADDGTVTTKGAGQYYMEAKTAEEKAGKAVEVHVIGLLIAANGQDIIEPVGDDSSTPAVNEAMTVAQLRLLLLSVRRMQSIQRRGRLTTAAVAPRRRRHGLGCRTIRTPLTLTSRRGVC